MSLTQSELIEVKRVRGKGRGVFALRPIAEGAEIERVPMLVVPSSALCGTPLADYAFFWGRSTVAVALGYGSLYNHSYEPNARYDDVAPQTKVFTAIRDIRAGEEITVNYNGEPDDGSDVGFAVL